jgi:hypothetical protein
MGPFAEIVETRNRKKLAGSHDIAQKKRVQGLGAAGVHAKAFGLIVT